MQIDFHHGTTYVLARWAGFSQEQAEMIAYASQYVDDAVQSGMIDFSNGAKFERRSSAHKIIDEYNFNDDANRQAWVLFHFLPGNQGLPVEEGRDLSFIKTLVCCPDSYIAREMLAECIAEKRRPYSLLRLGITLHVYADTWAHQGFAGVKDNINSAQLQADTKMEKLESHSVCVWPLGHGMVLSYPDQPWRSWQYQDSEGNTIEHSNTDKFIVAANGMMRFMQRYLVDDVDDSHNVKGLTLEQTEILREKFSGWTSPDEKERHNAWLAGIAKGEFIFPGEIIKYSAVDAGSWKATALQTTDGWSERETRYIYSDDFLRSPWKMFHDALQAHSFFVLHELLPRYGICIA